jgi:hypothetical protein
MEDASDDAGGPEKRARKLAGMDRRTPTHQRPSKPLRVPSSASAKTPSASKSRVDRDEQDLTAREKISIDRYLDEVALFCNSEYGNRVRDRFKDGRGTSELAMLAAPTSQELEELRRAVAIMTPSEKNAADRLSDEQIEKIAVDARIDPANFAIFMNGYALLCKRVS